ALAIDPQTPATLYAGTNRYNGFNGGSVLVKSTDGGGSWSAVNTGLPNYPYYPDHPYYPVTGVYPLAIDPHAPTTLSLCRDRWRRRIQEHSWRWQFGLRAHRPDRVSPDGRGHRPPDAGHALRGDKCRRIQEHQWRGELERHRPDQSQRVRLGYRPPDAGYALCGDPLLQRLLRRRVQEHQWRGELERHRPERRSAWPGHRPPDADHAVCGDRLWRSQEH